mmetsp:Transcript_51391/g.118082  ORF Transcript_51391/g.118082 Transcript_51391/m.118082 type:complete len:237 (-) Transcript_51391:828-1538(-)
MQSHHAASPTSAMQSHARPPPRLCSAAHLGHATRDLRCISAAASRRLPVHAQARHAHAPAHSGHALHPIQPRVASKIRALPSHEQAEAQAAVGQVWSPGPSPHLPSSCARHAQALSSFGSPMPRHPRETAGGCARRLLALAQVDRDPSRHLERAQRLRVRREGRRSLRRELVLLGGAQRVAREVVHRAEDLLEGVLEREGLQPSVAARKPDAQHQRAWRALLRQLRGRPPLASRRR